MVVEQSRVSGIPDFQLLHAGDTTVRGTGGPGAACLCSRQALHALDSDRYALSRLPSVEPDRHGPHAGMPGVSGSPAGKDPGEHSDKTGGDYGITTR
jgi:hypothetical protein